jgi:hypothetical protein
MLRRQSSACAPCASVTSLAPRGVGVWGAGLLGNGAVELLPDPEPAKYGHEAIARGGSVRVPAARVVPGRGPAVSPTNPGLQGARVIEIHHAGTLQPDRLGFGRSRGGIQVPVAQVAVNPEALAARFALEGTMDRPASAIPITVDQAVEVLKAAESGFRGTDAEYADLVADAQRLKLLRAATARRPLSGDERAVMEAIANKYGAALEGAVADSTRSQRILDSSEARAQSAVARGLLPERIRSTRAFADRVRSQLSARFAGHDREQARLAASIAAASSAALGPALADIKDAVDAMAASAGVSAGAILGELAAARAGSSAALGPALTDIKDAVDAMAASAGVSAGAILGELAASRASSSADALLVSASMRDIKATIDAMAASAGVSSGDILRELATSRAASSAEAREAKSELDAIASQFGASASAIMNQVVQIPSMINFAEAMIDIGNRLGMNARETRTLTEVTERLMGALVGQAVRIHTIDPANAGRLGTSAIPAVRSALAASASGDSASVILKPNQ